MGIRYWILWFLVLIIIVQLVLPRWKDMTTPVSVPSQTAEVSAPEITLFDKVFPLSGEYRVYNNLLAQQSTQISESEYKQFQQYLASETFQIIQEILKNKKIPHDFVYIPRILTHADTSFVQGEKAGLRWLDPTIAQDYDLRVDTLIDERFSREKATLAIAQYIYDLYDMYGDWNMVALSLLSDADEVRQEYLILSQYQWDVHSYQEALQDNSISPYQSFPSPKGWNVYENMPLWSYNFFSLLYWKTLAQYPEYQLSISPVTTIKKTLKWPLNLIQRSEKNKYAYGILKLLNPQLRGSLLPKGKWEITVVK